MSHSSADDPVVEDYSVKKVVLFCDNTLIITRYEKIMQDTTGDDLIGRMRALVPPSHHHLGMSLSVGATGVVIIRQDLLLSALRPTECVLDVNFKVDKLDKAQVKQTVAILRSAMSYYDAHPDGADPSFEQVKVDLGSMRPVTPPRGPKPPVKRPPVARPVFDNGFSMSVAGSSSAGDAMDGDGPRTGFPLATSKSATRPSEVKTGESGAADGIDRMMIVTPHQSVVDTRTIEMIALQNMRFHLWLHDPT